MPEFDRSVLAQLFPRNPKAMADFEKLNRAVDVTLPEAAANAQTAADEARLLASLERSSVDAIKPLLETLNTHLQTARSDRATIAALERRVADLETRLLALQRNSDIDQLRRQLNDIQSLQTTR
jgi:polyhydroxyalkanoate synthesis regulator phasin